MEEVNELFNNLVDYNFFTFEELDLITNINGYNIGALNDCIYARYGCRNWEQLMEG